MKIEYRKILTVIATALLTTLFMGSAAAKPEAIFVENDDGAANCNNGVVENVITALPFYVWVKDAEVDEIDVTNDGDAVDSDFFPDSTCGLLRGKKNKSEDYFGYLVCAELFPKGNGKPETFKATGFDTSPFENIGSDSFRWSGGFPSAGDLDDCCDDFDRVDDDDLVWDGSACVTP